MVKTDEEIDKILTDLYESRSERDDDDECEGSNEYDEGVYDTINQIRSALGIPVKEIVNKKYPNGNFGRWEHYVSSKNTVDDETSFKYEIFPNFQTITKFGVGSGNFWSLDFKTAALYMEDLLSRYSDKLDLAPKRVSLKQMGINRDGNPYGTFLISD